MRCALLFAWLGSSTIALSLPPCQAQVTSDSTLNTTVNTVGNNATITNGTVAGSNLFHSFGQFGIPTGGSATFDLVNTSNISTIFSRVTGGSVSNIDGVIQTINGSNPMSLFLINPAGILFGPNARLNIGGSFIVTTASSIRFADGTEFGVTIPTAIPLLTVSVPIGLQVDQNSGTIQVTGNGHTLTQPPSPVLPLEQGATPSALEASPGTTLALVSSGIVLDGGVLLTDRGRVELGSVDSGRVGLSANPQGWSLTYAEVQGFQDIRLTQRSMISDRGDGTVKLQGRDLTFLDGSVIFQRGQGSRNGGDVSLNAAEITLSGIHPTERVRSGIYSQTLSSGKASDIAVTTNRLLIQDGGIISSASYATGAAGNIQLHVSDFVQLNGASPFFPIDPVSRINSVSFRDGNAGSITISTNQLMAQQGGAVSTSSLGTGSAGELTINTSDLVMISGVNPLNLSSRSSLDSLTANGNAGRVTINVARLKVTDGGTINAGTIGSGVAGSIYINASESVEVRGGFASPSGTLASQIVAATIRPSPVIQRLLRLSPIPSGTSGDIVIQTRQLKISDGGLINLENVGLGNAGTGRIRADSIVLDTGGRVVASTRSGKGGNIFLQANLLKLRHGSSIIATAGESGDGGNIVIDAKIVTGFENSDIIANAVKGRGGNINITTQGIFGLKFRPQLTPDSDITASSQLGVNGMVQVNTIGVDPNAGLVELLVKLTDSSRQIVVDCTAEGQFVVTGRGGIPDDPTQVLRSDRTWADTRDLSEFRTATPVRPAARSITPPPIVEASILRQTNGQLELVAANSPAPLPQAATCARASVVPITSKPSVDLRLKASVRE